MSSKKLIFNLTRASCEGGNGIPMITTTRPLSFAKSSPSETCVRSRDTMQIFEVSGILRLIVSNTTCTKQVKQTKIRLNCNGRKNGPNSGEAWSGGGVGNFVCLKPVKQQGQDIIENFRAMQPQSAFTSCHHQIALNFFNFLCKRAHNNWSTSMFARHYSSTWPCIRI